MARIGRRWVAPTTRLYVAHSKAVNDSEAQIQRGPHAIRMRIHTSEERYSGGETIYKLKQPRGDKDYVMAKPYILEPNITLTIATYPQPSSAGAIGEVLDSQWEGMRHRDIGNAQAWYYREDKVLVLWECDIFEWARQDKDPSENEVLTTVWTGFERWLLERFKATEMVVTPSWEPVYTNEVWQRFLITQGYTPFAKEAFIKEITR